LPELPHDRRRRFESELELPPYDAAVLTEELDVAEYFEETLRHLHASSEEAALSTHAKAASNFVMTDVLRAAKQADGGLRSVSVAPSRLAGILRLRLDEAINSSAATDLFDTMLDRLGRPRELAAEMNLLQVRDDDALAPVIDSIVNNNPKQVAQYRSGKTSVIGFLIGQVMRGFEGSPDPKRVRELLIERLES
jgi:aspartyl-tRNA(Asn)/glutamyl-tRNA(Gln) amidotransferase subunit B